MPENNTESRARLLVATAVQTQLAAAVVILRQARDNIRVLQQAGIGVGPALENADQALLLAEKAHAQVVTIARRIP